MGINTKSFDNASDMITFSRSSGGYGFTKVGYGSELVTNGTFDTGIEGWRVWTYPHTPVISYDSLNQRLLFTTAQYGTIRTTIPVVAGVTYRFTYTTDAAFWIADVNGNDPITGTVIHQDGESLYWLATSTRDIDFVVQGRLSGSNQYYVDNVSVKEVTYNSSDPSATLELIYHPNDVPRIEYNLDGTAKGLLIEEARTNLFTNSNAIDSTLTSAQSVTPSDEEITTGVYQGTWRKFTEDIATAQHRLVGTNVVTIPANSYATISCLVKRISGTRNVQLMIYTGGDNFIGRFDLDAETSSVTTGGTGTAGTSTIENLGNGIYRVSASGAVSTTATNCSVIWRLTDGVTTVYTGDGTSSIAVTGMQIEQGAFRTSLIKTTGATATRAVDVASIGVGAFGYNSKKNTLVVQAASNAPDNNQGTNNINNALVSLTTSATNNVTLGISSTSSRVDRVTVTTRDNGGSGQGLDLPDNTIPYTTPATSVKIGTTWSTLDDVFKLTADGVATVTSSMNAAGDIVPFINLEIKEGQGSAHIKSITYYPRRLTDAQIQRLTQPISTPTLSLTFDGQATSFTEDSIHG